MSSPEFLPHSIDALDRLTKFIDQAGRLAVHPYASEEFDEEYSSRGAEYHFGAHHLMVHHRMFHAFPDMPEARVRLVYPMQEVPSEDGRLRRVQLTRHVSHEQVMDILQADAAEQMERDGTLDDLPPFDTRELLKQMKAAAAKNPQDIQPVERPTEFIHGHTTSTVEFKLPNYRAYSTEIRSKLSSASQQQHDAAIVAAAGNDVSMGYYSLDEHTRLMRMFDRVDVSTAHPLENNLFIDL